MRRGRLSGARPANAPLHRPRARWRPTWTRPAALPTASWVPSCWGASSRFSACSLVAPRLARSVRSAPRRTRPWRWLAATYPSSARASPTAPRTPPRSTHRRPPTASPKAPRLSRRRRRAARRCRRSRRSPPRRATPIGPSRPTRFQGRSPPRRASPTGPSRRTRAARRGARARPPRSSAPRASPRSAATTGSRPCSERTATRASSAALVICPAAPRRRPQTRARRPTSRRPRLPRRRAPSLPPAGSLGPSSARPTCSASLASSRCSASEPRLRSPRTLPPPRFSPRSGTSPRLPFPQSQRRSRRHRLTASARLAATTRSRLQPSCRRTARPPTTRADATLRGACGKHCWTRSTRRWASRCTRLASRWRSSRTFTRSSR
mmetsp:Transcript_27308/g.80221  ORF Transcript_27308/g.80221 Transcript_27308/m.80221 type:complete len:379 (-) Transcript_27308:1168-2304(-)